MSSSRISLDEAVDLTRTGDVWIFRGRTTADRAIQLTTNSPVNHVGMAVTIEDLPPLMWHAELGHSLVDLWSGKEQRGVQLHDLRAAVLVWAQRYGQRAWLRQLHVDADAAQQRRMEDAVLRTIARLDGTPFPRTARLAGRWARGRVGDLLASTAELAGRRLGRRLADRVDERVGDAGLETVFCAEVVATTYAEMGLLETVEPANYYDPGSFWSGDDLPLTLGARLGEEIEIVLPT